MKFIFFTFILLNLTSSFAQEERSMRSLCLLLEDSKLKGGCKAECRRYPSHRILVVTQKEKTVFSPPIYLSTKVNEKSTANDSQVLMAQDDQSTYSISVTIDPKNRVTELQINDIVCK